MSQGVYVLGGQYLGGKCPMGTCTDAYVQGPGLCPITRNSTWRHYVAYYVNYTYLIYNRG